MVQDKSIPQGAATTLFACIAAEVVERDDAYRGAFLSDCRVSTPSTTAQDASGALRERLWQVTEEQLQEALKAEGLQ